MHRVLRAVGRQWRWVVVLVVVRTLLAPPAAVDAVPAQRSSVGLDELATRIKASAGQPYHGYAEGHGGLRLPELPGAADLSTLTSDTSRSASGTRARTGGGPTSCTRAASGTATAPATGRGRGFGTHRAVFLDSATQLRLPIPIDLTPPDLARRLVAAAQPDEITSISPRRIAGHDADGIRIVPVIKHSTVDQIDLWADPTTGLPLHARRDGQGPQHAVAPDGVPRARAARGRPRAADLHPAARCPPPVPGLQRPRPRAGHRAVLRDEAARQPGRTPRRTDVANAAGHVR